MASTHRALAIVALVAPLSGIAGCSSADGHPAISSVDEGGAGERDGCAYRSSADLTTPAVSFDQAVMPIFRRSCAISGATCHGDPSVVVGGRPFLGFSAGGDDPAQVGGGLVGVASSEVPSMPLVSAGDVGRSYLMRKMDANLCDLRPQCAQAGTPYPECGSPMPQSSGVLDVSTRDVVRRWIAQGAHTN